MTTKKHLSSRKNRIESNGKKGPEGGESVKRKPGGGGLRAGGEKGSRKERKGQTHRRTPGN